MRTRRTLTSRAGSLRFTSRHEFYPVAVRMCGIGAVIAAALSFALIASGRPFLALANPPPSPPSVAPDQGAPSMSLSQVPQKPLPPTQSAPVALDPELLALVFGSALIAGVSSSTTAFEAPQMPKGQSGKAVMEKIQPQSAASTTGSSTNSKVTVQTARPATGKPQSFSLASTSGSSVSSAITKDGTRIGSFVCKTIQTAPELDCVLRLQRGGSAVRYVAAVRQTESNLGVSRELSFAWEVFAASPSLIERDVAGSYSQATGGARGAPALVGGKNTAITLRPRGADGATATIERMQLAAR